MHSVDTSALVKLVVREAESDALRAWAERHGPLVTSDIARTELLRAVVRVHPGGAQRVRAVLETVSTVGLTRRVLEEAGRLAPPTLPSLDAIHLAVALSFGDDLVSLATYDARLREAAEQVGLRVEAPAG